MIVLLGVVIVNPVIAFICGKVIAFYEGRQTARHKETSVTL